MLRLKTWVRERMRSYCMKKLHMILSAAFQRMFILLLADLIEFGDSRQIYVCFSRKSDYIYL